MSTILTDPTQKQLKSYLDATCKATNGSARTNLISTPRKYMDVFKKEEGIIEQFGGASRGSRRSGLAGVESSLGIAWCTVDGVKSVLVVAKRGFARANPFGDARTYGKMTPVQVVESYRNPEPKGVSLD